MIRWLHVTECQLSSAFYLGPQGYDAGLRYIVTPHVLGREAR